MSRCWEIVFCVPLLFRRYVFLSNSKHAPSRELPLTDRKTVFRRLIDFFRLFLAGWTEFYSDTHFHYSFSFLNRVNISFDFLKGRSNNLELLSFQQT